MFHGAYETAQHFGWSAPNHCTPWPATLWQCGWHPVNAAVALLGIKWCTAHALTTQPSARWL